MDYNDPRQRQYARQSFPGQLSLSGQPQSVSQQQPGEGYRQPDFSHSHSASEISASQRVGSEPQLYRPTQGSQYGTGTSTPTVQYGTGMQITASPPQQGNQPFGTDVMYSMTQPSAQTSYLPQHPYSQVSTYQQRPSAGATQPFAGAYGVPTTIHSTSGSSAGFDFAAAAAAASSAQFPPSYVHQASPPQTYAAMMDTSPPRASFSAYMTPQQQQPRAILVGPVYGVPSTPQHPSPSDQVHNNYRAQIVGVFSHVNENKLRDAVPLLSAATRYLLSNVNALGLNRDDQGQYRQHLTMWTEFNHAWLVTLQRQYDVSIVARRFGQHTRERSTYPVLDAGTIRGLVDELVQLCNGVESAGLVDYELGVREEEIVDLAQKCLRILERDSETSTSAGAAESSSSSAKRRKR